MELTRPAGELAALLRAVLAGEEPRIHYLQGILDAHGWPDVAKVVQNAEALERISTYLVTFDIDERSRPSYRCHCGRPCITPQALAAHRRSTHYTRKAKT